MPNQDNALLIVGGMSVVVVGFIVGMFGIEFKERRIGTILFRTGNFLLAIGGIIALIGIWI